MPPMAQFGRPGLLSARNLIAGGIGVVVVVAVWLGIRSMSSDPPPPPPPEPVVETVAEAPPPEPEPEPKTNLLQEVMRPQLTLLAAKRDIEAGELLMADAVEWRPWRYEIDPETILAEGDLNLNQILSAVARLPVQAGSPILRDGIILPGSPGFVTTVLAPGHRAVTVRVDDASASAKIIHPGDRVDLTLVGATLSDLGPVAQLIVPNVRVLAIDANFMKARSYGVLSPANDQAPSGNTYTLEVTPKDADRIALAATVGQLSVALRSEGAQQDGLEQRQLVGLQEIMRPPEQPPQPGFAAAQVRIIRGPGNSETVVVAPTIEITEDSEE